MNKPIVDAIRDRLVWTLERRLRIWSTRLDLMKVKFFYQKARTTEELLEEYSERWKEGYKRAWIK